MSLPTFIIEALKAAPGLDPEAFCKVHEQGTQVSSIRVNPAKFDEPSALSFSLSQKVPWSRYGYYLEERPAYTFEPLLHAGAFYVQEASSMFLEQAVQQTTDTGLPLKVLDLSAAPGGKSTHLQSLLGADSLLVSNEVIKTRVSILEENMVKWGGANVVITNNDPRDFSALEGYFDLVVVDAPCSGSGMFRKDPASMEGWSTDLVALCSQRQQRILADIWPALKPGGVLVYSTCSYSVEENEQIADWIMGQLGAGSLPLLTDTSWNIVQTTSPVHHASGYRFYPDKLRGEGFYLAAFRKTGFGGSIASAGTAGIAGPSGGGRKKSGRPKWEPVPKNIRQGIQHWLRQPDLPLISLNGNLIALTGTLGGELEMFQSLYLKQAGVSLGKWAGNDLVPDHAFALSGLVSGQVQSVELDRQAALAYLRKEDIHPAHAKTGWNLVRFMGHPLGWMKVMPNRSNNYYPKEWRILKQG